MSFDYDFRGPLTGDPTAGLPLSRNAHRIAMKLLSAIYEKTGGRSRGVRDVTELETGLTAKAARDAWRDLLGQGLIERFSQDYAARLSDKGMEFIGSGGLLADPGLPPSEADAATAPAEIARPAVSRKVFIVRDHRSPTGEAVLGFLKKLDLQPVVLHDDAGSGLNVTEQAEKHRDVEFAIVLLTPQDLGIPAGETAEIHPTVEVILELGYFIGRLGRTRVCALVTGLTMQEPAKLVGVGLDSFDPSGAWRSVLTRELQAAGYSADWDRAAG